MYATHVVHILAVCVISVSCALDPKYAQDSISAIALPVDISGYYNSRAFASEPNDADMDGLGSKFLLLSF